MNRLIYPDLILQVLLPPWVWELLGLVLDLLIWLREKSSRPVITPIEELPPSDWLRWLERR